MGRRVLVIGAGGREHAIAWKLSRSPQVEKVFVAPGNDGMSFERWPISVNDFSAIAEASLQNRIDLVVVGPDNPLADGIVDELESHGLRVFGPSASAARIEASKAFAKRVMEQSGVPTAKYESFGTFEEAERFLNQAPWETGWVVKADGLALGKGVQVCTEKQDAIEAARRLIRVSGQLLIEERLVGEEVSWMAFCDGKSYSLLEPARDYKRLSNGNLGPNTGGMGAYSPVPELLGDRNFDRMGSEVFQPVLDEMRRMGNPFKGVLYAGLMVCPKTDQFWVLEFNARFGDPETQVLLPRMKGDLFEWMWTCVNEGLDSCSRRVPFVEDHAVVVVGGAPGYPESPEKGIRIPVSPLNQNELGEVFWAGVSCKDEDWFTSGGRVFGAVGMAESKEGARKAAYDRLEKNRFDRMLFRTDIAK